MPEEPLDPGATRRFIQRKQHLGRSGPSADLAQVVGDVGGLHNTGPTTPYLSLFARVPGFTRAMLEEALYLRKSLVRVRCMRSTLHLLPLDLAPAVIAATRRQVVLDAQRFCRHRGVDEAEYGRSSREVVALLADGGRTTAEIRRAIEPVTSLPAVLLLLCDQGVLARGETPHWRSNAYTYHLFSEYLPGLSLDGIDEDAAVARLVCHYFSTFGPATEEDATWWTGLGKLQVWKALGSLSLDHVEIDGQAGDFLATKDDLRAILSQQAYTGPAVSLLPGMDPMIMGYKARDRYISREHYSCVFDRSGNSTNTIVVDGHVEGVWECAAGETPCVKYLLFEEASQVLRRRVTAEAQRIGEFISGGPVAVRECRSIVPLAQRPPGAVLSPLNGQ